MRFDEAGILAVLDRCAEDFRFPMLDNGYVYLAASRLALFRSEEDWALTIEIFGFMPRAQCPDLCVYAFGSRLCHRKAESDYVDRAAYEAYLARSPHDEPYSVYPLDETEAWIDPDDAEALGPSATTFLLRGERLPFPAVEDYPRHGVELGLAEDRVHIAEFCRYLAAAQRERVLATETERRFHLPAEMRRLLVLDDWQHPDLAAEEMPSAVESFRQLAEVLASGDPAAYRPTRPGNTHWRNWPDGGTL